MVTWCFCIAALSYVSIIQASDAFILSGINRAPGGVASPRSSTTLNKNSGIVHSTTQNAFPRSDPPYVAVITERNACDSQDHIDSTVLALERAISRDQVDLVSVRVHYPHTEQEQDEQRPHVVKLIRRVVALAKDSSVSIVVSSDWIDAAIEAGAHGIHFKETHRSLIPSVRKMFEFDPLIGTSCHSIESALSAWEEFQPDYMFVGTCYMTESHPEKAFDELEGPELPGRVCAVLDEKVGPLERPRVLAIGGIDPSNCHEPVERYGADGAATIRAVLHANDPATVVAAMKANMVGARQKSY